MVQANNAAIKKYENELIQSVLSCIEKHGGNSCLSSIILTGSFGRGEPTYKFEEDRFCLKSDVELALIFPASSKKQMIEKMIRAVSAEYDEELNLMAINEKRMRKAYNFNFSLKIPKYKTIFTYDLFNGSKTIWGQDFIADKQVLLSDVDIYEAKRLVANRIGELVYLQNHTEDREQKAYLKEQWKGKLMLAIASAWLICEGKYVSSYCGQKQIIKDNLVYAERALGKDFFEEYDKVFRFLREGGKVYGVPDAKLVGYVKLIDCYFKSKKISRPKVNSVSRMVKYILKYVKTGMKYGVVGFENAILQALIDHYGNGSDKVVQDAEVWRSVLY